jgi:hypothetical protein
MMNSFHTWQVTGPPAAAVVIAAADSIVEGFPTPGSDTLCACGFEVSSTLEASVVMRFVQLHMLGFVGSPGSVKHRVAPYSRHSRFE